jgi:hypothetical protein
MDFKISTSKIATYLLVIVITMTIVDGFVRSARIILGFDRMTEIERLFHTSTEGNVPTWIASMLLISCSVLLGIIAKATNSKGYPYSQNWIGLSLIFLYISLDEAASIHEISIDPLRSAFNASGIFHFSWVIIALPLLLIFVGFYLRFLFHLPKDTRLLFIVAGGIYVMGAMGVEMIGGFVLSNNLVGGKIYGILIIIEEFLENLGTIIFIFALINYIKSYLRINRISLEWI